MPFALRHLVPMLAALGGFASTMTASTYFVYVDTYTAAEVDVHPSGKSLYASNRGPNRIAVFAIGADGRLQASDQVPSGGRTPRGFSVDASGRWLIAANHGTHNVDVFAIDPDTGMPRPTGQSEEVRTPVCVKFLSLGGGGRRRDTVGILRRPARG